MDRSTQLATLYPVAGNVRDAIKSIQETYPGSKYLSDIDSFEYRGVLFDYFRAGRCPAGDGYMLVDKEFPSRCWVFTYGEPDIMWKNYLDSKALNKRIANPPKGLIERILEWLFK